MRTPHTGSLTYRTSDGRWIARVQMNGARSTASQRGPNTPAGRKAAERMLQDLIAQAGGAPPRRRRLDQVWPIEPLLEAAGVSVRTVAQLLGLNERTGYRWAHQDVRLTDVEADWAAIRLGLHPAIVWPGWA